MTKKKLTVRLTSEMERRLRTVSQGAGMTKNAAIVQAILEYVRRYERHRDPGA